MNDSQPRGDSGEFEAKVTELDILKVFDAADEPFLTASEIAERLPVSRQAVNYRLNGMHDEGLLGKKKVGARAVGWWAEVAPEPADSDAPEYEDADGISQREMQARLDG